MPATQRLPGVLVIDADGAPYAILPASRLVEPTVPAYVIEDPAPAAADEPHADRQSLPRERPQPFRLRYFALRPGHRRSTDARPRRGTKCSVPPGSWCSTWSASSSRAFSRCSSGNGRGTSNASAPRRPRGAENRCGPRTRPRGLTIVRRPPGDPRRPAPPPRTRPRGLTHPPEAGRKPPGPRSVHDGFFGVPDQARDVLRDEPSDGRRWSRPPRPPCPGGRGPPGRAGRPAAGSGSTGTRSRGCRERRRTRSACRRRGHPRSVPMRIVRGGSRPVVTGRRVQMTLLLATPVGTIAAVTSTSAAPGAAHPGRAGYSSTDTAVLNSPNTSRAYSTRARGSAAEIHRSNAP